MYQRVNRPDWHRLSNINAETRTAICSIDGMVPIHSRGYKKYKDGQQNWRCAPSAPATLKRLKGRTYVVPKTGACEICGAKCNTVFDHDHKSGLHRGWLCRACNLGLGSFRDNPTFLENAIAYLGR